MDSFKKLTLMPGTDLTLNKPMTRWGIQNPPGVSFSELGCKTCNSELVYLENSDILYCRTCKGYVE